MNRPRSHPTYYGEDLAPQEEYLMYDEATGWPYQIHPASLSSVDHTYGIAGPCENKCETLSRPVYEPLGFGQQPATCAFDSATVMSPSLLEYENQHGFASYEDYQMELEGKSDEPVMLFRRPTAPMPLYHPTPQYPPNLCAPSYLNAEQTLSSSSSVSLASTPDSNSSTSEGEECSPVTPDYEMDLSGVHEEQAEGNEKDDLNRCPDQTDNYARLIRYALISTAGHRMILHEIYDFFKKTWPRFRRCKSNGWRNSIRHNLSMNGGFIKEERPAGEPGKGCVWVLSDDAYKYGVASTTSFRAHPFRKDRRGQSSSRRRAESSHESRSPPSLSTRMSQQSSQHLPPAPLPLPSVDGPLDAIVGFLPESIPEQEPTPEPALPDFLKSEPVQEDDGCIPPVRQDVTITDEDPMEEWPADLPNFFAEQFALLAGA